MVVDTERPRDSARPCPRPSAGEDLPDDLSAEEYSLAMGVQGLLPGTARRAGFGAMNRSNPRCQILIEYAKWTALSAAGRSPIRAMKPVYQLLDGVAFTAVLNPSLEPISCEGFERWHRAQTKDLCARAKPMLPRVEGHCSEFPVGWSAKLINVYLKTAAYVGDLGREGLRDMLHPPVDNRLRDRLVKCFRRKHPEICDAVRFKSIRAIATYEDYQKIIGGCRAAAEVLGCSLFEVEQLWSTGDATGPEPPRQRRAAVHNSAGVR